ncbi:hypothetical protein [Aeromonas phage 13AhydR10PP]|nr:hypothetical protein [Aeromonas phage 13AhydR10PP]
MNMTALGELLASQDITPRIERVDIWGELEHMGGSGAMDDWPPKPRKGEQTLAIGHDETGAHVAIFIPY